MLSDASTEWRQHNEASRPAPPSSRLRRFTMPMVPRTFAAPNGSPARVPVVRRMTDRMVLFVSGPWHGQVMTIKRGVSVVRIEGIDGREYVRNHDDRHEWFEWRPIGWDNRYVADIREATRSAAYGPILRRDVDDIYGGVPPHGRPVIEPDGSTTRLDEGWTSEPGDAPG